MVTIASDEGSVRECSEWSSFILAALICQKLRIIDASIVTFLMKLTDTEGAFLRICHKSANCNFEPLNFTICGSSRISDLRKGFGPHTVEPKQLIISNITING